MIGVVRVFGHKAGIVKVFRSTFYKNTQFFYTKSFLGIEDFERKRMEVCILTPNFMQQYKNNWNDVKQNPKVRFHDLISAIYISQPEDTNFILKLVWRFYSQNTSSSSSVYDTNRAKFGPLLMRMLWLHKQVDEALQVINFAPLQRIFQETTSYLVLFDLLLNNERYEEVVDVYKNIYIQINNRISPHVLTFVLAACYKLNTNISCLDAINFIQNYKKLNESEPSAHHLSYLIMMLIKQNKLDSAFKLLEGNLIINNSTALQNLWLIILTKLMRLGEVVMFIQEKVYQTDKYKEQFMLQETIDYIAEAQNYAVGEDKSRIDVLMGIINDEKIIIGNNIEERLLKEIIDEIRFSRNTNKIQNFV